MKIAVVTGASSGIGAATARELARRGWKPVLVARRRDRLEQLASELGGEFEVCDVSERADVDRAAAAILERHPRIDLLVNNAGIPGRGDFFSLEPDRIEAVLRTNYLGCVWMVRALEAGLQRGSHVVNVVSVAGTVAFAPAGPYAASKHAQLAFSRSLTGLLAGRGVTVHTVLPGFVETEGFPQKTVLRSAVLPPSRGSSPSSSPSASPTRSSRASASSSCRAGTESSRSRRRSCRGCPRAWSPARATSAPS